MIKDFENFINEKITFKTPTISTILNSFMKDKNVRGKSCLMLVFGTRDECEDFLENCSDALSSSCGLYSYGMTVRNVYEIEPQDFNKVLTKKILKDNTRSILFVDNETIKEMTAVIHRMNYMINLSEN